MIFELHSDNQKDFYISIRHDGRYLSLCEEKYYACRYEEWRERVRKNVLVVDIKKVCGIAGEEERGRKTGRYESVMN